jgi:hypothetical protein
MSGRLVSAVFESALPPWLKRYATACASFAAEDGTKIYPTMVRLARMTGRSERATQTAVHELIRRGVLIIEAPHTPRRATRYRLNTDALPHRGDPDQLPLFQQAARINIPPATAASEPGVFHSHAQALTGSGLHPRGEVGFTRSFIDPSFTHPQRKRARARNKGRYQKTGTE